MSPALELGVDKMAEAADEPPRVVRRKFATPPVKLACLSWSSRASRTRCDGGHPCASCVTKGNDCIYRPSRRGGPRVRKKAAAPRPVAEIRPQEIEPPVAGMPTQPIAIQNFVDPGAALGQLPDLPQDSDFIFDSLFPSSFPENVFDDMSQNMLLMQKTGPSARTYRSDRTLLDAYYCWIHPYFPILPPPEHPPVDDPHPLSQNQALHTDPDFEPTTPLTLALSAILALIPCPGDTDPVGPEAVLFRRKCAQFFAQSAIESIEAEAEMPDSATEPQKALESSPPPYDRMPFHPRVPIELESIIALDLLSAYEYGQRGNIKKMRSRAGQAMMDAIMFSLHKQTDDEDYFAEAKRRIWWMTYICTSQSSIVSGLPPPLELFDASFTTKFPTLDADPDAWADFITAQQMILRATQFIAELNKTMAAQGEMEPVYRMMSDLESQLAPQIDKSDAYQFTGNLAPQVDVNETVLVRSLRAMAKIKINSARIKVHRYCAFYDYPVFVNKVCDLKTMSDVSDGNEPLPWPSCSCSPQSTSTKSGSPESSGSHLSVVSTSPHTSADTTPHSHGGGEAATTTATGGGHLHVESKVPFSSHHSAKICLRAALAISHGFDNMPYPNPTGQFGQDVCFLSPTSPIVAPRMVPTFVCCAMQAAYVFLSVYRKTQTVRPGQSSSGYLVSMLLQLQRGLTSILAALENYATAFEALRSMRENLIGLEG